MSKESRCDPLDNHVRCTPTSEIKFNFAISFTAFLFEASGAYILPYSVLGIISVVGGISALLIAPVTRRLKTSSLENVESNTAIQER